MLYTLWLCVLTAQNLEDGNKCLVLKNMENILTDGSDV